MEEDEGEEEAIVQDDGYALLVAGGVHPLLAARAADTALPEAFVLAWALLLACMNDAGHDQRRRLGLTCGNVDRSEAGTSTAKRSWDANLCYCETLLSMHMRKARLGHHTLLLSDATSQADVRKRFSSWTFAVRSLTAELINMLVAVLPLEEAQKASKAKSAAKQGSAPSAAQAAAAAAAARAAGAQTSLSREMLRLGECCAFASRQTALEHRPSTSYLTSSVHHHSCLLG